MEEVSVSGVLSYEFIEGSDCASLILKFEGKHFGNWEIRRLLNFLGPMDGQGVDIKITCYRPKAPQTLKKEE